MLLFQEICSNQFDWDNPLTGETKGKWDRWIKDLSKTKEIQIDRCLYDVGGEGVEKCYSLNWEASTPLEPRSAGFSSVEQYAQSSLEVSFKI